MKSIKLPKAEWHFDENSPLGDEGGFGRVFMGSSSEGHKVAVKRLKLTAKETAHRELDMSEHLAGRALKYVIPILDSGIDANSDDYFIVMAKAEKSLQGELDIEGKLNEQDCIDILLQVVEG